MFRYLGPVWWSGLERPDLLLLWQLPKAGQLVLPVSLRSILIEGFPIEGISSEHINIEGMVSSRLLVGGIVSVGRKTWYILGIQQRNCRDHDQLAHLCQVASICSIKFTSLEPNNLPRGVYSVHCGTECSVVGWNCSREASNLVTRLGVFALNRPTIRLEETAHVRVGSQKAARSVDYRFETWYTVVAFPWDLLVPYQLRTGLADLLDQQEALCLCAVLSILSIS